MPPSINKMAGKGYYYEAAKDRWVARITIDKKRHHIGSFKTEEEAKDAVDKFLNENNNNEMPPRRRTEMPPARTSKFTLEDALKFIDEKLNNPQSTKDLYKRCLIVFTRHYERDEDDDGSEELSLDEIKGIYENVDLVHILTEFDRVKEVIEEGIKNSRTGEDIATDTKKHYYSAICSLCMEKVAGSLKLDKELIKKYQDRLKELNIVSNQQRNLNLGGSKYKYIALNPDLSWEKMGQEYLDFIKSENREVKKFTNTEKGRKDLRCAVIVGLYILQRPRRVEDYWKLQLFSREPSNEEQKDKNLLWLRKEGGELKGTLYIDKFKIRYMVRKNVKKEILPRYVKDIHPKLAVLFDDYIKAFNIKDMAKRTAEEKRNDTQYYLFYPEDKDQSVAYPDAGGYGSNVKASMMRIFKGRRALNATAFRHYFNKYLSSNIDEFNDEKLAEIAVDVGDTFKGMPQNLRYRWANEDNLDKSPTQIFSDLRRGGVVDGEESVMGGSVAERNIEQMEVINEVEEDFSIETDSRGNFNRETAIRNLGELEIKLNKLMKQKEDILKLLM